MLKSKDMQLSMYTILYSKILENHILKLINSAVDFSLKYLAKKIFKTLNEENGEVPETINQEIPKYKKIEDHKEAKATMKAYLEETMTKIEENIEMGNSPKTKQVKENAKEILKDPKFIEQRGVRSIVDQEARVGHKSKTEHFFGYKTEYIITTEDRIITAVRVNDGAYVDGTQFNELIELTKNTGLTLKEVYGDKAYFKKPILDKIKEIEAEVYIPVSEMAYKIDEERFSYNKDSDEFYSYSQQQKTEDFKEKYKKRACQEWENGEMKNFHGLDRARGYGLKSMSKQAKLTALAVNLKRIANILSSKMSFKHDFFSILLGHRGKFLIVGENC